MVMFARVLSVSVLAVFASTAQAVSFDCQKAKTFIEKAICQNPDLSELDDELGSQYQMALTNNKKPEVFKKQQLTWLKQRDTCQTVDCVKKAYKQRIATLVKYNNNPDNFKSDMGGE
ncbi:MAG: lysozyme inhibitor LprI family protein [Methylococcaceae bacterium]|nr:lysozyme inhibitor LprI family protein [Methylococcaceae bacterium]